MDLRDNNEPVRLDNNDSPLVIEEKRVPLRNDPPPPPKPAKPAPRQLSKQDELVLALIILAAAVGLIVMRVVFHFDIM